jgi:tetratricopeptide (TPR) repeat protein
MVGTEVLELNRQLAEKWNPFLQVSPVLEFDFTWPSLGVVDLLTFPLRLKTEFHPEQEKGIQEATAYLATIIESIWSKFCNVDCGIEGDSIILYARGGEFIPPGEEVLINVTKALRVTLQDNPSPFPVLLDFQRLTSFDSNVIQLLATGLVTGLSSHVVGAWENKDLETHKACLEVIQREISKQCANWYARAYPNEPLGQVAELYLNGLIFPPLLMDEACPALRAIKGILQFGKDYKIKTESLRELARNFSKCPDEIISIAGTCLSIALSDAIPEPEIIAAAQSRGKFLGVMRHTIVETRKLLEKPADWIETGINSKELELQFAIDEALGSIPWFYLSLVRVKEVDPQKEKLQLVRGEKLLSLVRHMANFSYENAKIECNELLAETPGDMEMRLQKIKLLLAVHDFQAIESELRKLLTEPGSEDLARFFYLSGLTALSQKQFERASKYLKSALLRAQSELILKPEIANTLAWVLMLQDKQDEALEVLDKCLAESLTPLVPLLNKAHILWQKGSPDYGQIRKQMFEIAPCDRRVFGGLTAI